MPECLNCESFVTESYVRVFAPNGYDTVRVCPNCRDKIRDGADVREARSTRDTGTDPTRYDPEKDPTAD